MLESIYFESYVRERAQELGLTLKELARRANVSRQTIHKLLNKDIGEAKLSTLVQLSKALEVHPFVLLRKIFWTITPPPSSKESKYPGDFSGFVADITYPDNEVVTAGSVFVKTWRINNLGPIRWENRRLVCVDDEIVVFIRRNGELMPLEKYDLVPLEREVPIPTTEPGHTVDISVTFRAPIYPCTTISYWKMFDEKGDECFPKLKGLWCKVQVVALLNHNVSI